jgi:hypothetical protein
MDTSFTYEVFLSHTARETQAVPIPIVVRLRPREPLGKGLRRTWSLLIKAYVCAKARVERLFGKAI